MACYLECDGRREAVGIPNDHHGADRTLFVKRHKTAPLAPHNDPVLRKAGALVHDDVMILRHDQGDQRLTVREGTEVARPSSGAS